MIRSFKDTETKTIFHRRFSRKLLFDMQRRAAMQLISIHFSKGVNDLRILPANHLEILRGDREGQFSIPINAQWRICSGRRRCAHDNWE